MNKRTPGGPVLMKESAAYAHGVNQQLNELRRLVDAQKKREAAERGLRKWFGWLDR